MTNTFRSLTTLDGRILQVPGNRGWNSAARLELCRAQVSRALEAEIQFAPSGLKNAGNLKVVNSRPDVLVRIMGGVIDREHRISLHVTSGHHEAIVRHMTDGGRAFQLCVAAVGPVQQGRATLGLACFDYSMIARSVSRGFARRRVRRMNLTFAARREGSGLSMMIPELRLHLDYGVEPLARVLRYAGGTEPSAMLRTEERVAVVAAVLELKYGLGASVAPLDARTKVAHRLVHAVGLPDVPPHRLAGRLAPCANQWVESLSRSDLIGAATTGDLLTAPSQNLTIVEVENSTRDGVEKMMQRLIAAEQLGLRATTGILVVRDECEDWFRRRLQNAPAIVQAKTRIEPMSRWYADYLLLLHRHIATQRTLVRRAAA